MPRRPPHRSPAARAALALVALALVAGACSTTADDGPDDGAGAPVVPDGYTVRRVVDGLEGPTQVARAPDGRLVVAQLAGAERAGTGQVLAVDLDDPGAPEVLVEDLATPTGVAVLGDELWIMERQRLSRGPLDGGPRTVVADDLPSNGRSEGALTATDEGALLYDTSGALDGDGQVVPGSGVLWSLVPGGEPTALATGFKHAYARTFDGDGTLWQTEIADGRYDGAPAPDELVAVAPGDDGGWPDCVGDAEPVRERGATAATCAGVVRSHALFAPGATPTSVAVAPWDPDVLLVALWVEGEVVALPRVGDAPVEAEPFLTGLEHPQDLLVDGDRLLVVDHGGGAVWAVEADAETG